MRLAIICTHTGGINRELQQLLGKKVNMAKKPNGAPYLEEDAHYVSVSHKDDMVVVAVSDRPVGVDIEKVCDKDAYYRIAERYFAEPVAKGDVEGFFRGWTRREAFGKMLGVGLNAEVMRMNMAPTTLSYEGEDVYFAEKKLPDAYMITVASHYQEIETYIEGGDNHEK